MENNEWDCFYEWASQQNNRELLVIAQQQFHHPGKRQNWRTRNRNFVYRPAICRLTRFDVPEVISTSGDDFVVHQVVRQPGATGVYFIKYSDFYEAIWANIIREELLECTPLAADIIDYVLKDFLVEVST